MRSKRCRVFVQNSLEKPFMSIVAFIHDLLQVNRISFNYIFKSSADQTNDNNCIPRRSTEERRLLYCDRFVFVEDTIQTCQKVESYCMRLKHEVTFYPGTMYSRTIDVGVCGGSCQENTTCKAIFNKTVAISTPKGERHAILIPRENSL